MQVESADFSCIFYYHYPGPPSVPTLSCVELSGDVSGAVNVTVSWTLSGGDSADFYFIHIITNAPQLPYGGLLNITNGSVTQHELTGFMADYEYNITVRGVNCGSQEGSESEPLTITPQGIVYRETYHIALAGACYGPRLFSNLLGTFAYLCGRFIFNKLHHANTHFLCVTLVSVNSPVA